MTASNPVVAMYGMPGPLELICLAVIFLLVVLPIVAIVIAATRGGGVGRGPHRPGPSAALGEPRWQCVACDGAVEIGATECPHCGHKVGMPADTAPNDPPGDAR